MIGALIALAFVLFAAATAIYRMFRGPDDAHRAIGSDLLFFAIVGLLGLVGLFTRSAVVFDLIIIATVVGFLASISLARALTNGRR
ncbi:monovalent cation/H+ antiporter complex subunit F [Ammonicoccus fulvus]|uniref:Monovalent cation/H+ antiporter complex subunit F n=1 Tax=Ammonicoccus fulvus TaxID=3138240 RepID=A0ABZ3FJG9_9ACTN